MAVSILDQLLASHIHIYALLAVGILLTFIGTKIYKIYYENRPYPGIPLISLPGKTSKESWIKHGNETITLGLQTTKDNEPFQIMTGTGPKIVLRNCFAEEVGKNKHLSFADSIRIDFLADYPGFEGVRIGINSSIVRDTIVRKLTQSLGLVTEDLVEETTDSIHDLFGESTEWKTVELKGPVQKMVSRLSSRVFLGKPLCRNPRWLEIATDYTIHAFTASRNLRATPSMLRPIKHWFMPACRDLRKDLNDARTLISGEVASRDAAARALLAQGKKPPKKSDAIAWFVEMAQEQGQQLSVIDLVSCQLSLTLAAIHTTTEATCQALQHLCEHPEFVQPLRDEVIRMVGEHGWAKTSLYQLRLMDSFLKESQRHCRGMASLVRTATSDVVMSDGYTVKRGSRVMLLGSFMDETYYPDHLRFDPYRFLNKSETDTGGQAGGQKNNWQYVSTRPEHLGFGLGLHACPGRFFVANELKIALAQLLLKYDWSFDPAEGKTDFIWIESNPMWNPSGKLRFRRRKEEVDLSLVN